MDTGGHHSIERKLKKEVADKRTTTQRRLEIAALSDHFAARVARSRHTAPEVLIKLMAHASYDVRCAVAQNPSAPSLVLEQLLNGADRWLTTLVAANVNLTDIQMDRLARSSSVWVKQAIASRADVPLDLLVRLGKPRQGRTREHYVEQAVARNPRTPEHILRHLATDLFFDVAQNPGLSPNLIRELAASEDEKQRYFLAWMETLPEDVIERLKHDPSDAVREAIRHSAMGQKTLSMDERIAQVNRQPVMANRFFRDRDITGADMERLFENGFDEYVAWHAFQHPNVSVDLVRRFIDDVPVAYGRYIFLLRVLALNPALPEALLGELCVHGNPDVRRAAQKNVRRREHVQWVRGRT